MQYNTTTLGALRRGTARDVRKFRVLILGALKLSAGRLALAASILGVSKASLKVYLTDDEVLRKAKRAGPGRPKTSLPNKSTSARKKELDSRRGSG